MGNLVTPAFRMAWCHLVKPKKNDKDEDRWSVTALFPKDTDLDLLKNAAKAAGVAKWGEDQKKWPPKLKTPFHEQGTNTYTNDEGEEVLYAGYEVGAYYVNFSSKYAPEIMNQSDKSEIIDESEVYSGCWGKVSFEAYAYEHPKGGKGIALGLRNVLKTKDDTPFGKVRISAKEEFESFVESDSDAKASNNPDDMFS